MADGDSTDAESENSNEDLNVHHFLVDLEAELENRRADLDHLDSMSLPGSPEDGEQAGSADELEESLVVPGPEGDSSDEEEDGADGQEAEDDDEDDEPARKRPRVEQQQIPGARRLRYKQPPPAAYVQMAAASTRKVLKRPAMRKRPAASEAPDSKRCQGQQGAACQFCTVCPGEAARAQPARGIHHCIFCKAERMREAHATMRRRGLFGCRVQLIGCNYSNTNRRLQAVVVSACRRDAR